MVDWVLKIKYLSYLSDSTDPNETCSMVMVRQTDTFYKGLWGMVLLGFFVCLFVCFGFFCLLLHVYWQVQNAVLSVCFFRHKMKRRLDEILPFDCHK